MRARGLALRRAAPVRGRRSTHRSLAHEIRGSQPGLSVRPYVTGELATHWPESRGLLPRDFGREPDRPSSSSCGTSSMPASRPPMPRPRSQTRSAPSDDDDGCGRGGTRDVRDARRTPFRDPAVLPIAATQPPGESSRLDTFRAPIAVDVLAALGDADGDPELADALDRWELSLFQSEPFRSEQIRAALTPSSARTGRCAAACCSRRTGGHGKSSTASSSRLLPAMPDAGDGGRGATRCRCGCALARPRPARARSRP